MFAEIIFSTFSAFQQIASFMLNPDFVIFNDNMLLRVREILSDVDVKTNKERLDVTVGEPRMPPQIGFVNSLWLNQKLAGYPKAAADQVSG